MNTHIPIVEDPDDSNLLCVNFNQDQGCFAVGHENGFRVYNTSPMKLRVKRNFNYLEDPQNPANNGVVHTGSGIGLITMLHRTNYLAIVGGGRTPKYPINKVIIWDDLKRKTSLTLEFMSPVLNVLLSRIRIIVVLKNQVVIYGFSSPPKKISSYETIDNDNGIADLSISTNDNKYHILAFPGRTAGQIQLVDVSPSGQERNLISIIKAHKSRLRCLAINRAGTMIASASETGTIIRVHSTNNTSLLYEFRRGLDRAIINCMKFSPSGSKLAVLSDKQTLHVFNINNNDDNRQHYFNKLPIPIPIPNYFHSTWSFVSIHINHDFAKNDHGELGWINDDSIVIIWRYLKIWEKYVIMEKNDTNTDGNSVKNWEIIRESWRNLGDLNE